jgi:DNA-binding IclR family transcriptional regulator
MMLMDELLKVDDRELAVLQAMQGGHLTFRAIEAATDIPRTSLARVFDALAAKQLVRRSRHSGCWRAWTLCPPSQRVLAAAAKSA